MDLGLTIWQKPAGSPRAAHARGPAILGMSPLAPWAFLRGASNLFPPMIKTMTTGFDRRHAAIAWQVALRLKEQGNRLGVPHGITKGLPENAADLEILEREIQAAAKALANATGIRVTSLEQLIDQLESYGSGVTYLRPWQY